jgi:hypothetical protein
MFVWVLSTLKIGFLKILELVFLETLRHSALAPLSRPAGTCTDSTYPRLPSGTIGSPKHSFPSKIIVETSGNRGTNMIVRMIHRARIYRNDETCTIGAPHRTRMNID